METAIAWFKNLVGKVTYSMVYRNGPNSYDCSSAVYHSLIAQGIFPSTIAIGNTDTLFGDLERHGFTQVAEAADGSIPTQRGDVFIWGNRGQSAGAFGHTGVFVDADNIIHCSSGYNGIAVSNHDWLWGLNGKPTVTIYRLTGGTAPANNPTDQIVETGSFVRFDDTYTVDDVQLIDNVWQVQTNDLCKAGFTWAENGIPAASLVEVDADGYATVDQELAVGSTYKIPGKFLVLDVGQTNGEWLAQVGAGGLTFWVDIATATEVAGDNTGTPVPSQRQVNTTPPPAPVPVETPAPTTPVVETPTPVEQPAPETPVVVPPVVQEPQPVPETPVNDTPAPSSPNPLKELIVSFFKALVQLVLHVIGKE